MGKRRQASSKKVVRRRKKRQPKKGRRNGKKIPVKKKFAQAISRLQRMKAKNQRSAVVGASNEFIRDVSGFMNKMRRRPDLVKTSHRKILKRHGKKLQSLVHAKTPLNRKRLILVQKGGIFPALIPIIVALIGAGGGIGAAATSAAIIRS